MSAKHIVSKCPIEELLVLIGGRWTPVILWWLFESEKPLRFKILRQRMPRISQKILTQQLRELERHNLGKREMFREMPVRVEYSLSPFGRKLPPCTACTRFLGASTWLKIKSFRRSPSAN